MNLFRVTVVLNVPGTSLTFTYRDAKAALEAAAILANKEYVSATADVKDDFSSVCQIRRDAIVAVMLCDIGLQLEGEAEVAYAHALKQKELQTKAQSDTRLKSGLLVPGNSAGRPS